MKKLRLLTSWDRLLLGGFVWLFFVFLLAPILVVVAVSFTSASFVAFPIPGLSLRWFEKVFDYEPFMSAMRVSLEIALLSTAGACLLGVPAALVLARSRSSTAVAVTTLLLAPLSMPQIVLGFALLFYLPVLGLGTSFVSLLVAHIVVGLPYIVRTVIGVSRSMTQEYDMAAMILGANRWQVFRYITLPLIRPGIAAGSLFALLVSLDNLPVSYFFGNPTTNTLPVVMLSYLEYQLDPSIAAVSTIQMMFAALALLIVDRVYGLRNMSAPG